MATTSIKKILLAGTAFAAASIISAQTAQAQVALTADATWGEIASGTDGSNGPGADAGDSVALGGYTLTIVNDGTAYDGTATSPNYNAFTLGTITNASGAGAVNITQTTNSAISSGPFTVSIAGIADSGTSSMAISGGNVAQSVAVTIGGGLVLGGDLALTNTNSGSTDETVSMTVAGATTIVGTTGLVAGPGSGNTVSITNTGDATYAGTVSLSSGAAEGANASITLSGASNTLSDGVLLNDLGAASSSEGQAILYFGTGTTTTTVTTAMVGGVNTAITGEAADEGTVTLLGSNTINGAIGLPHAVYAVNAGVEGTASSITGAVNAENVTVNGGGDGTAGSVAFGSTLTAGTLTVESGGLTTAQAESATVTGAASMSTLTAVAAGTYAGANATLILNGSSALAGATGEIATTAGTTATLELNGAANTLSGIITLDDSGIGSNGGQAILDFGTGSDTVAGITGAAADEGTVNLFGSDTISGAIGTDYAVYAVDAGVVVSTGVNTASSITGAVNAGTVTIYGINDVAANGAVTFDSTLTVGTGGMAVASADTATNAQGETATVNGVFTDAGALNITAGTASGANATLNLAGATNTITGVTTLTDGTAGLATLNVAANSAVTFGQGGIVGGASGEGTLAFAGASTVTGQIGSQAYMLRAVTVTGGGLDAFSGSIYATSLIFNGANTVQIADGQTVDATITAPGSTGTLTLAGSSTITGTVGASGAALTAVNAGAAAGKTDTFTSAIFATNMNIGAGTAVFDSGVNFTGNINGTGAGVGNLVLAGSNTITGEIGNSELLDTLTLNGSVTVTSAATAVNAANTTTLNANTLAVGTNNFTLATSQTLASTISSASAYGQVTSSGTTTVSATSKVDLNIDSNVYLPTHTFVLISGGAGTSVDTLAAGALTVNGKNDGTAQTLTAGVMTYTQGGLVSGFSNELAITATNNGAVSVASTPNNVAVAAALDTIAGNSNAALQAVQGGIANANSAGAVNNILSTLSPTVDGGAQRASLEVSTEVQDITDTRMTALLADDGSTGVAAGASNNGVSMWLQGYGENATQDERDYVAGYHATTWGSAIGADTENVIDNGVLGLAVNYGKATVNSNNLNTTATDVGNYGLTFYGVAGLQDHMFLEGQMGYAYNKIDSVRHDVGGISGDDADGDTHSSQYDARISFGRDYWIYGLGDAMVTPDMSASYTHLNTQAYTETGPGSDLVVGANSQNEFDIGVGEKLAWQWKEEDGSVVKPVLKADYSYAVVDDRIDTTASFTGADAGSDPSFVTQGPVPERNSIGLGAGITYMSVANWDMSANYDFEYRPDYRANAGTLRATAHF